MTYVQSVDCDELRIVLCVDFDPHAAPGEVSELKSRLIDCPNTLHAVEVTGTFDFIAEVAAPDMAWFNNWLKGLAEPFARLVRRSETNFICRRFIRRSKDELALWVPSGNGLKRIEGSSIDKIVAEGDYARVHSGASSWLLHATMHSLLERLSARQFVQLHRSIIVRSGFIDRLTREGRHWVAHLRDGSRERIAQGHVAEVLKATHSPKPEPGSPIPVLAAEAHGGR